MPCENIDTILQCCLLAMPPFAHMAVISLFPTLNTMPGMDAFRDASLMDFRLAYISDIDYVSTGKKVLYYAYVDRVQMIDFSFRNASTSNCCQSQCMRGQ